MPRALEQRLVDAHLGLALRFCRLLRLSWNGLASVREMLHHKLIEMVAKASLLDSAPVRHDFLRENKTEQ
jgi:hypothetical protein